MQLCQVIGQVWGSEIHPEIEGYKIVKLVPYTLVDGKLNLTKTEILGIDALAASVEEDVLISSRSKVRDILLSSDLPIKTVTIAIVDGVIVEC